MKYTNILRLDGKTVVITGASSGIGRECAVAASQLGASVALIARNKDRLNETLSLMEKGNHGIYSVDITKFSELEGLVSKIVAEQGKIESFIHSAGIEGVIALRDMTKENYDDFFNINVYSGLEMTRIVTSRKHYSKEGGCILFLSSVLGVIGQKGKTAYCATKGALISASKAIALELAKRRIRVNCVVPGMVRTEMVERYLVSVPETSRQESINMHPLGLGEPQDVAALCMFLLSDAAKWITGAAYVIDGGYSAV